METYHETSSWKQPTTTDEVEKYFKRYQKHMEIDFHYNNQMTLSHDYLQKVCFEWTQVAKILVQEDVDDDESSCSDLSDQIKQSHHHHGGFITIDGYIQIANHMEQTHGFTSWRLNTRDLCCITKEFQDEPYMSLRRFCLYLEDGEIYDEHENALRLVQPEYYYSSLQADNPMRTHAYLGGDYDLYRRCCLDQLALDLDVFHDYSMHNFSLDWYIAAFEREDPEKTGFIRRDALLRVLHQLCCGESVPVSWTKQHRQPALKLLCKAIPVLLQDQSLDNILEDDTRDNAILDQLDAMLRIDSEFSLDIHSSAVSKHSMMLSKNYRVSLRQFCTFVERPAYDYAIFPTRKFQEWIQQEEWSPALHCVLCRYYCNTIFQRQVITLLLMNQSGIFGKIGDAIFNIISFLHRNLNKIESFKNANAKVIKDSKGLLLFFLLTTLHFISFL